MGPYVDGLARLAVSCYKVRRVEPAANNNRGASYLRLKRRVSVSGRTSSL